MKEKRDPFQLILENAADMISKHDREGVFIFVSSACRDLTGYSPHELIGRNSYEFFHPDDLANIRKSHQEIFQGPITYTVAYRFQHKQGHYVWVETTSKTAQSPDDMDLFEIFCTTRNITARKRIEENLLESEERFRVLFEQAKDCIFVNDLEGRFHAVNAMACETLGYTEAELLNLSVSDIDPEFVAREDEKRFWPSLPRTFESLHKKRDGSTFPVEVRLSRIVYRDKDLILAIVSDITLRKEMEEERERLIHDLKEALASVRTLSGLFPICASCKKIRDDRGYWNQIEAYIQEHSEAEFSHSLCPDCIQKLYPFFEDKN